MEGKEWFIFECILCVFGHLSSLSRLSLVSVVLDFNDSLNDVASVSPISLPVDEKRKRKKAIVDGCFFVCLLSFVFTIQIKFSECCV